MHRVAFFPPQHRLLNLTQACPSHEKGPARQNACTGGASGTSCKRFRQETGVSESVLAGLSPLRTVSPCGDSASAEIQSRGRCWRDLFPFRTGRPKAARVLWGNDPLWERSPGRSGHRHQAGVAAGGCGVDAARNFFKHLQDVQALFGREDADECAVAVCQFLLAAAVQRA